MSSEMATASRFSPRARKLLDLGFQLGDGLFEIEIAAHHDLSHETKGTALIRRPGRAGADTGDCRGASQASQDKSRQITKSRQRTGRSCGQGEEPARRARSGTKTGAKRVERRTARTATGTIELLRRLDDVQAREGQREASTPTRSQAAAVAAGAAAAAAAARRGSPPSPPARTGSGASGVLSCERL